MSVIIIILLLASFELGVFIGMKMNSPLISSRKSPQPTYQAGWDAAKKRLAESGFAPMMAGNLEIKDISGQITDIKDNKIALKIRPIFPLDDPALDNRVVMIDNNTKIYQLTQKAQKDFQVEMQKFNQEMQDRIKNPATSTAAIITPPEMFIKNEAKISDLRIGQQITVGSDSNIAGAKEIRAVEITLQYVPEMTSASSTQPTDAQFKQ